MKKITLYVDEKELKNFDSAKPQELSRSEAIRGLMANFFLARTSWNNAAGIIVGKPTDRNQCFIIQLIEPYQLKLEDGKIANMPPNGLIKVSVDELVKHNLNLGNYVVFGESNWKGV